MKTRGLKDIIGSFLLGVGMLLTICTNLRFTEYRIGPGELVLLFVVVLGFTGVEAKACAKNPVVWFVGLFAVCATIGANVSVAVGGREDWYLKAYIYTGMVTIGLAAFMAQCADTQLRKTLWGLTISSALMLWFGFIVYIYGDVQLINALRMADAGDLRYSGWSENPNQLALFFVPLPVWLAALWRDVRKPNPWQIAGFCMLLLSLMLMGLLVRSDGLFVVWVFEFVVLLVLRVRWDMKVSRLSLLGYALAMVLCVLFVKTFAHGEVRKSFQCATKTLSQGFNPWKELCYDAQSFEDQEAFRIGYSNPVEKTGIRQELWRNGLTSWEESPWFGHGPGNFSWLPDQSIRNQSQLSPELKQESHNMTIEFMVQGGILPGLAWVSLIGYLLVMAWKAKDSYSFSVVLMMAVFTSFHVTRQPYLWFALIMSYEAIKRRLFSSSLAES
jgi:hypothetical protein